MRLYSTSYKPSNSQGIRDIIAKRAKIVSESQPDKNGVVVVSFLADKPIELEVTGQGEPFNITIGEPV